jgi:hypothetical protein
VTKGGAKKSGEKKKDARPAGPGAIAAGGGLGGISVGGSGSSTPAKGGSEPEPEVHIKATGLDNMLEALEIVNAKADKGSVGAQVRYRRGFSLTVSFGYLLTTLLAPLHRLV